MARFSIVHISKPTRRGSLFSRQALSPFSLSGSGCYDNFPFDKKHKGVLKISIIRLIRSTLEKWTCFGIGIVCLKMEVTKKFDRVFCAQNAVYVGLY